MVYRSGRVTVTIDAGEALDEIRDEQLLDEVAHRNLYKKSVSALDSSMRSRKHGMRFDGVERSATGIGAALRKPPMRRDRCPACSYLLLQGRAQPPAWAGKCRGGGGGGSKIPVAETAARRRLSYAKVLIFQLFGCIMSDIVLISLGQSDVGIVPCLVVANLQLRSPLCPWFRGRAARSHPII